MLDSAHAGAPGDPGGAPAGPARAIATLIHSPRDIAAGVRLADLVAPLADAAVRGDVDVPVRDLTYRSGECRPGLLFFCVPGTHVDGHDFAPEAAAAGAVGVVAERFLQGLPAGCAQVRVPSVRAAMGPVSATFFGRPADRMRVVGVTGTNGKTTTTFLLESIFRAAGLVPGVVGTTGVRVAGRPVPFDRTTPEAPDLHRLFAGMVAEGVEAVAAEVSSHGLDQHRVDGTRFACAVFTNLSQDHLDYHGTMEAYFTAKARLFTPVLADRAVVNADSPEGRRLVATSRIPVRTFGTDDAADVRATRVAVGPAGLSFVVDGLRVESRLRGTFNVSNCLAAYAAARELEIEGSAIADGIAALEGVPGRVEAVDAGQAFSVLVDYAHTPDGLDNVLRDARALAGPARVIAVFGCGGDRDRAKRPLMGEAATRWADLTVVTSDNPRSEDPEAIVDEIVPGARRGGRPFTTEVDRRHAIRVALATARPGDVVVIAGKGHETGQQFADRTIPFDDRVVAREELAALLGESP